MKKTISLVLAFALVIALSVAGTVAYLQDKETVTNTFKVGNVNITLDEAPVKLVDGEYVVAEGNRVTENKYETLVPGQLLPKDPTVTNEGANAAWIRVDVTLTDYSVFADVVAREEGELADYFGDFDDGAWTLAGEPEVDPEANTITYSYYYNTKLLPEKDTGPLFKTVTIPESFTAKEFDALGTDGFQITLVAHAIQADGFESVTEAFNNYDSTYDPAA